MENGTDILDKIIECGALAFCKPVYTKHKEGILYIFFGGLTVAVAILIYALLVNAVQISPMLANAVSWICGVTFSFFTTRRFVFKSEVIDAFATMMQMLSFFGARLATLILQEILLFVFIEKYRMDSLLVKVVTEFLNIVLNYLMSKFVIFKRNS